MAVVPCIQAIEQVCRDTYQRYGKHCHVPGNSHFVLVLLRVEEPIAVYELTQIALRMKPIR